jgi:hypothetical protein
MANITAIHSVGTSLVTYLRKSYPQALREQFPCEFSLLSGGEINRLTDPPTTLSLFVYRVTINEHLRNTPRPDLNNNHALSLTLDLHYLLTVWADQALHEQVILGWAMRQLFMHPILDASSLDPGGGWQPGDAIHLVPSEHSTEDVMRIWNAIAPPFRISVSYVARVVRIDADAADLTEFRPVVASRFTYTDRYTDTGEEPEP